MRRVVPFVLAAASFLSTASVLGSQGGAAKPALRACSLLPKELVTRVTPYDKRALDLALGFPPSEEAVGQSGSSCSYVGIHLQVDPFPPAVIERQRQADAQRGKAWVAVPEVGDAAYFRDNRGEWGELYARAGARVLTIQMDVPQGRTAESIKPNVVALAQAIVPRLR